MPVEVIRDVAAERGADSGREDDRHAVKSEGLAALLDGEGVGEDGLLAWRETSAAETLQDAGKNEDWQRGGESAQKGAGGEDDHAGHVEALATEAVRKPSRDGKDDRGGDEIAGEDPGGLVLTGTERACYVRQGHVGDGGVEHFHEGGERHGESNGPRIMPRLPLGECKRSGLGKRLPCISPPDIIAGD